MFLAEFNQNSATHRNLRMGLKIIIIIMDILRTSLSLSKNNS